MKLILIREAWIHAIMLIVVHALPGTETNCTGRTVRAWPVLSASGGSHHVASQHQTTGQELLFAHTSLHHGSRRQRLLQVSNATSSPSMTPEWRCRDNVPCLSAQVSCLGSVRAGVVLTVRCLSHTGTQAHCTLLMGGLFLTLLL